MHGTGVKMNYSCVSTGLRGLLNDSKKAQRDDNYQSNSMKIKGYHSDDDVSWDVAV
jgi:hypothetical protein